MYLEGDDVTHGDSARMMSSSCQLDGPVCFHFWYYMYGSATGMALNIYKLQANQATKIWSTMNNQGPEWHLGKADLKISGSVKVRPFDMACKMFFHSTLQRVIVIIDSNLSVHN